MPSSSLIGNIVVEDGRIIITFQRLVSDFLFGPDLDEGVEAVLADISFDDDVSSLHRMGNELSARLRELEQEGISNPNLSALNRLEFEYLPGMDTVRLIAEVGSVLAQIYGSVALIKL